MLKCSTCDFEVNANLYECPNCGSIITSQKNEKHSEDPNADINEITSTLTPTIGDDDSPNLEADIELSLKSIRKSLGTSDFTGALSNYHFAEKKYLL